MIISKIMDFYTEFSFRLATSVTGSESHTEKMEPQIVIPRWKPFQGAAVLGFRGNNFSSFAMTVNPISKNAKILAQAKCREACEENKRCCMICTKPIGKTSLCTFYDTKFGGRADEEIESISTWITNEDCAYKTEYLGITCMAQ